MNAGKAAVLVTGGRGFIAGHLLRRLARPGRRIVATTRSARGVADLPGVEWIEGDPLAPDFTARLPRVDAVVHLAASVDLTAPPGVLREVNVEVTARLARWAAATEVGYFLFASSIEAQGPSERPEPQAEDAPCRPVSAYGESKLLGERAAAGELVAGALLVARIGNVYGPGSPGFVEPLARLAPGSEELRRIAHAAVQPVFVEDLAAWLEIALERRPTGIVNLAGDETATLGGWAEVIGELVAPMPRRPAGAAGGLADYVLAGAPRIHRLLATARRAEVLPRAPRHDLLKGTAYTLGWLLGRAR